jgi:hypothetical protein
LQYVPKKRKIESSDPTGSIVDEKGEEAGVNRVVEPVKVGVNTALVKWYSLNTFSLVAQETNHEYQAINL